MKSRLIRLSVAATFVMATGLTAACGAADPSAAAIVDGQVIKESDISAVVQDLARIPANADLPPSEVVGRLILAQVVRSHAAELNAPAVSADAIRSQLEAPDQQGKSIGPWSPATVEALREVSVLNAVMQSQSQAKAVELMQKAQVTVNPRYGTFDPQRLALSVSAPNWMVQPSSASPDPSGQPQVSEQPPPRGNPSTLPGAKPTAGSSGSSAPNAATPTTP